jgi:hypothetical protein
MNPDNRSIRFTVSREHALASHSRVHGSGNYEPTDEELATLSVSELALLSVFQGEPEKGPRLRLLSFPNPPWIAIAERLRHAFTEDVGITTALTEAGMTAEQAERERGALEIGEWLRGVRSPLKLSKVPTEKAVQIVTWFADLEEAARNGHPVANAFTRRLAELLAGLPLASFATTRELFRSEFETEVRPSPRPFALQVRGDLADRLAELRAWLPPSTVLDLSGVLRIASGPSFSQGYEKFTGLTVEVSHPGSAVPMVVAFSTETETP